MDSVPRLLREFAPLERKRRGSGLSVTELQRWTDLKRQLDGHFKSAAGQKGDDRRASQRVPTCLEVSCESTGNLQRRLMTNLSQGGMFINTDSPLGIGTQLRLRIEIEETGEVLEIVGRVCSTNVGNAFTREPGMGIRFVDMPPEVQKKVDKLYERLVEDLKAAPEEE